MQTISTTVKLNKALKERISILSQVKKRSTHSLLLEAIEDFVDKTEKREAFRQEGVKAYEEYMKTGLHLTNNEVMEWLEKLSTGKYEAPPKCHI